MPFAFITDHGTQFDNQDFEDYCTRSKIRKLHSAPGHPQCNDQTEVTNRMILDGIKKRLDEAKGNWINELHSVLWAYRTTPRTATGETPYMLVFGAEAVVPTEIGLPSHKVLKVGPQPGGGSQGKYSIACCRLSIEGGTLLQSTGENKHPERRRQCFQEGNTQEMARTIQSNQHH